MGLQAGRAGLPPAESLGKAKDFEKMSPRQSQWKAQPTPHHLPAVAGDRVLGLWKLKENSRPLPQQPSPPPVEKELCPYSPTSGLGSPSGPPLEARRLAFTLHRARARHTPLPPGGSGPDRLLWPWPSS